MPDQVDWRAVQGEGNPARAVGRLLRDQREELGLSLSDVGQRLRIRRPYIEAIEDGRFEDLPGAAYIPAFLRAYSVHLGLDPQKVLTAYQAAGAKPIERPTGLPADFPLTERRTPYGLAVLTVLLLIAAGYAVWHFMPQENAIVAQKVPPVPDLLLAERPPNDAQRPATDVAPPPPASVEARAPQGEKAQTPPAEMWPLPKSDTVTPPSTVTIAPPPPVTPPVAPQPAAPPPTVATIPPPAVTPPAAVPPVAQPAPPAPAATVGQAQAAQPLGPRVDVLRGPIEPQQEARTVAPREERSEVSRPVAHDTPIGVRVDSWVELRSANGEILAQTYVRAGESYTIPAGIAFRVINAR